MCFFYCRHILYFVIHIDDMIDYVVNVIYVYCSCVERDHFIANRMQHAYNERISF